MANSFPQISWSVSSVREPSFEDEARSSGLVHSHWSLSPQYAKGEPVWDVVVDPIAGWFTPLWGSDQSFLYLRRPEGAWKVALPTNLNDEIVLLSIKSAKDGLPRGPVILGDPVRGRAGWLGQPSDLVLLTGLDQQRSVAGWAGAESADAMGHALCDIAHASSSTNRLTIEVYDDASGPPSFRRNGDWLFGTDPGNGRVVAYALDYELGLQAALDLGKLGFRYSGSFLVPFEVRVIV